MAHLCQKKLVVNAHLRLFLSRQRRDIVDHHSANSLLWEFRLSRGDLGKLNRNHEWVCARVRQQTLIQKSGDPL